MRSMVEGDRPEAQRWWSTPSTVLRTVLLPVPGRIYPICAISSI